MPDGGPVVDGGTVRLPRLIGLSRALDLILTGRPVHAQEALAMGLVSKVVDDAAVYETARDMARTIAGLPLSFDETQLRDILRALERAAEDERIERLVIVPDHMTGAGYAALREIGDAIRAFKESGKQVVAYADNMSQEQYYLAAFADEVYMHPAGGLLLEGLGRYRNYYREGLQDKLGVDVHLFRVGEFKSAAEPYILDAPSEESRQADLFWMGDLWQRYLADIGAARGIDPKHPYRVASPECTAAVVNTAKTETILSLMGREGFEVSDIEDVYRGRRAVEKEAASTVYERGIPDGFVRMSLGIEDAADLIGDIDQGLG